MLPVPEELLLLLLRPLLLLLLVNPGGEPRQRGSSRAPPLLPPPCVLLRYCRSRPPRYSQGRVGRARYSRPAAATAALLLPGSGSKHVGRIQRRRRVVTLGSGYGRPLVWPPLRETKPTPRGDVLRVQLLLLVQVLLRVQVMLRVQVLHVDGDVS